MLVEGVASGTVIPVSDGGGALTVDGTVAVTNAGLTALEGAIAGTEVQVDVLTMPTVTVNAHAVTNAGTFAVQVDGSALTALQLIDDTVFAEDAAAQAADKGIAVLAVRRDADTSLVGTDNDYANLQVDANGYLKVEIFDSGDSHTIDGTVTANLSATDNAVLDAIEADTTTIAGAVSGTEMQVDVVAALPAGTAYIGKTLPTDRDITLHSNYAKKYYTNAGAVTDGIVWSPAAGTRWHVVSLVVNVSAAATVTFEDDKAGGDEAVLKMELAANSGAVIPFGNEYPLASGEDAADLIVTTSAGNVYITAIGYEI